MVIAPPRTPLDMKDVESIGPGVLPCLLKSPSISTNIKSDSDHCDPLSCVASGSRCHTADYLKETNKDVNAGKPALLMYSFSLVVTRTAIALCWRGQRQTIQFRLLLRNLSINSLNYLFKRIHLSDRYIILCHFNSHVPFLIIQ